MPALVDSSLAGMADADGRCDTEPDLVMAAQSAHDVVKQAESVGDRSPTDVDASTINHIAVSSDDVKNPSDLLSDAPLKSGAIVSSQTTTGTKVVTAHHDPEPDETAESLEGKEGVIVRAGPSSQDGKLGKEEEEAAAVPELVAVEEDQPVTDARRAVDGPRSDTSDLEDEPAVAAPPLPDVGAGSDNETGRRDRRHPSTRSDPKGPQMRSNSVRKPASFKAVSVTKSFLAKAATGSSQAARPGLDKGSHASSRYLFGLVAGDVDWDELLAGPATPNGQPVTSTSTAALRPRLVAKSGRSRDHALPGSPAPTTGAGGPGSAPDPIQVWNKNRRQCPFDISLPS